MARVRRPAPRPAPGTCRICGREKMLISHNIINDGRLKQIGRGGLVNGGNLVRICEECYRQTYTYLLEGHFRRRKRGGHNTAFSLPSPTTGENSSANLANEGRCEAMTEMFDRCKHPALKGEHLCRLHKTLHPSFRMKW